MVSGTSGGGGAPTEDASAGADAGRPSERTPNVVFVLIDDLGYGDLPSYGNADIETPNLERMSNEGTRFTQFYVASPICSPSRVAFTTGEVPGRYRVHAHFDNRAANQNRQMPDYLPADAPSVARQFKAAGYATAHFGKWHQGGGRNVDDAPWPTAYGFDESLVSFEGLGDRVLINGDGLSQASALLGQGNIQWAEKHELAEIYVNRALDFIGRNQDTPFLLHLWLNDVHDPFHPKPELLSEYAEFASEPAFQNYYAVIDEMDRQLGRLFDALDELGLSEDTLVLIASDNGPTAWPLH
jgi:arylsulfatase A-like enzyme